VNPRMQDMIGTALKPFDDRQRKVLDDFLSRLIASDLADEELSALFSNSGADYYLRGSRNFFGEVLKRLR
jgi:hypothetical protein